MGYSMSTTYDSNQTNWINNQIQWSSLRTDRDNHVQVFIDNVRDGYQSQFAMEEDAQDMAKNTPYDFLSIMHYRKDSFAKRDANVRRT